MTPQTINLIVAGLLTLANTVTVIYLVHKQEKINQRNIEDLKNLEAKQFCKWYHVYENFQKEIDRFEELKKN